MYVFKGAPSWVRFAAQDSNGKWFWYKRAPARGAGYWVCNLDYRDDEPQHREVTGLPYDMTQPNPYWHQSLVERPA